MRQYAGEDEAAGAAPAWRGGYYRLLENTVRNQIVLAYASEWESPAAARHFFRLYQKALKGKWKTFQVIAEDANSVTGKGDDGYFALRIEAARITSLEGMQSAAEEKPAALDGAGMPMR